MVEPGFELVSLCFPNRAEMGVVAKPSRSRRTERGGQGEEGRSVGTVSSQPVLGLAVEEQVAGRESSMGPGREVLALSSVLRPWFPGPPEGLTGITSSAGLWSILFVSLPPGTHILPPVNWCKPPPNREELFSSRFKERETESQRSVPSRVVSRW